MKIGNQIKKLYKKLSIFSFIVSKSMWSSNYALAIKCGKKAIAHIYDDKIMIYTYKINDCEITIDVLYGFVFNGKIFTEHFKPIINIFNNIIDELSTINDLAIKIYSCPLYSIEITRNELKFYLSKNSNNSLIIVYDILYKDFTFIYPNDINEKTVSYKLSKIRSIDNNETRIARKIYDVSPKIIKSTSSIIEILVKIIAFAYI